ncbi:MAG: DEAD/DEAH box helicase family protein [archaeon]|nr:DEAD/DEAH box helicase family protein [archaeon]
MSTKTENKIEISEKNNFYFDDYIKKKKIIKRDYQVNIVESSFSSNSLVVLPTALGKTIIALMVAAKHLKIYNNSKILVLAPTKPLVMQLYESFKSIIIENIEMEMLIGNIPPLKRALRVNQNRIIFSTPQIIKNDIERGSVSLRDFTLIIFDEAHKARKNYAYTFIAKEYMNTAKKPFILALTASPGNNSEIINTLIQKLYIERLCFKTEDDVDFKDYIYPIELLIEKIHLPISTIEIQVLLKNAVKEVVNYFISKKILSVKNYYSKVDFIRLNQDFRAFELYGDDYDYYNFPEVPIILSKKPLNRFSFVSMAISGIYLLHLEEILTTQTPKMFVDYCAKLKSRAELGSKSANRITNSKYFKNYIESQLPTLEFEDSPKISALIDIVEAQFINKQNSKIIIFTQFRDMATIIKEKLIQLENSLIIPDRFVGQFSKPGDKGLTQNMQREMINYFKNNEISVLVATSIAEEGLDIPNVDAVIFYEPIPSEIRLIQRRGRTGRHSKGLCYILCAQDTLDNIYLNVAFRKEERMHKILLSEDELEILTNINRSNEIFLPDKKSDEEIFDFFNDLAERKKITAQKEMEMLISIKNSEAEKKRLLKLKDYGVNDITAQIGQKSIERLEKTEKNLQRKKEEKFQMYYDRRKQRIEEKIRERKENI